jgi:hypothetical protein
MASEFEYTVHFQKGARVGARSFRMVPVQAVTPSQACAKARLEFPDARSKGYHITRVDHSDDNGRIIIDEWNGWEFVEN